MTAAPPPGPAPDAPAPRRRLRAFVLNTAVLGAAFLLAAGLAEVLVRLVAPQQLIRIRPDIWQPMDSVGWANRPNVRTTINTGERTVDLFTDAEGMRVGRDGRHEAPTRVLVIGDSFMEALQVNYEQCVAALLETGLTARLGRPVAVRDAGVDAWDPPQYLIRTRSLLARDSFGLVVVAVYLGNDIVTRRIDALPARVPSERHRLRLPRRLRWPELVDAWLYPVNDFLEVRSHLFILLRNGLHPLLARVGLTVEYSPAEMKPSEAASPRWSVTAGILADLAAATRAHGVPAVFVLIPEPASVDTASLVELRERYGPRVADLDPDQPDRLMRAELAARGLTVVSVLGAFRAEQARGTRLYGTVDRHLTPEGHALLERLVEPVAVRAMQEGRVSRPAPQRPSR